MKRWTGLLKTIVPLGLIALLVFFQNCSKSGLKSEKPLHSTRITPPESDTVPIPTVEGNGEPYEGKLYTVDADGSCGPDVPDKSAILYEGGEYWLVKIDCAEIEPMLIPANEIQLIKDADSIVYKGETYQAESQPPSSLSFSKQGSTYLTRTPVQEGNRQTWTWSAWVRRSGFGDKTVIFSTAGNHLDIFFDDGNSDANRLRIAQNGGDALNLMTQVRYTDPTVWLHIVLQIDTTQALPADRAKLYVNGQQITAFASTKYPDRDRLLLINSTIAHDIGRRGEADRYFDGDISEMILVDGISVAPSAFGMLNGAGVWAYKPYHGEYGQNGFHMRFADALGNDSSGNQNHFTPFNF